MISHEHRLIFIHIPKCAGTSVERRFGHFDGFTGRRGQDHRPMRMIEAPVPLGGAFRSRDDATLMVKRAIWPLRRGINPRNKLTVTPEQFRSYYKFTIIRDPWTRSLSWYRNVISDPVHRQKMKLSPDTSLEEFLRRFAGSGMMAPTQWWIRCFDGAIRMDRIIRFDDLQKDFAAVLRDLALPGEELEKHNVGKGTVDLASAYSAGARAIVSRVYAEEIARFGFTWRETA